MRTDFIELNATRNRETAELADAYASHRDRVMQLIRGTVNDLTGGDASSCSSAVLLGPGNCLDVDFSELSDLFQTLHLVDLDRTAVHDGISASGLSFDRMQIHAPVDIAEPLLSLTGEHFAPGADGLGNALEVLQQLSSENGVADIPEADVVVSLCVFSQILDALQQIISDRHPIFAHALKSVRIGHLRRMLSMLRPGGVAIFVTDIVSSDTAPELKSATTESMPDLVKKLVEEQNFFSGTNPAMVLADLNMLSRLPNGADTVHTIDPWPWQMGERTYAVYALRIQKKLPLQDEGPQEMPVTG